MRTKVVLDAAALRRLAREAAGRLRRERLMETEEGRRALMHPEERKEARHDPG